MFNKPLAEIETDDIESLIDGQVDEMSYVDYKEQLSFSDSEKAKLLKFATGLANQDGGYIIFGLREARDADNRKLGYPLREPGLAGNTEDMRSRLLQTLGGATEPPLRGYDARAFRLRGDVDVIVLRVPRSLNPPHMVKTGSAVFHVRRGTETSPMTYLEIREAFLSGERSRDEARAFINQRMAMLPKGVDVLVLHVLPIGHRTTTVDLHGAHGETLNRPLIVNEMNPAVRYNLDGVQWEIKNSQGQTIQSSQIMRTGGIEALRYRWIRSSMNYDQLDSMYLKDVAECVERCSRLHQSLAVRPPFAVQLVIKTKTPTELYLGDRRQESRGRAFQLPAGIWPMNDVVFNDFPTRRSIAETMRPVFDQLWQGFGIERCRMYRNDDGSLPGLPF